MKTACSLLRGLVLCTVLCLYPWAARADFGSQERLITVGGSGITLGCLTREVYTNIPGLTLADLTNNLKFSSQPDIVDTVTCFEVPPDTGENFGVRLRGLLLPPITGDYIFYIACDDQGALFLSKDADPVNKVQIAFEPEWDFPRTWLKPPGMTNTQNVSLPIHLEAGKRYYVEALMKEAMGGDCLGVAWQKPGDDVPVNGSEPIPGQYLAIAASYPPVEYPLPEVTIAATDAIAHEVWDTNKLDTARFTFTRTGDFGIPLEVWYTVSGTAQPGVDYQEFSLPVTIPTGQASADLVVRPYYDTLPEVKETVIVTLSTAPVFNSLFIQPYTIGTPDSATVEIFDPNLNPTQPPSISVTQPCEGSVFEHPESIMLVATAKDSDGRVTDVQFYDGNDEIGPGESLPDFSPSSQGFALAWYWPTPGDHVITALARDNDGASTWSVVTHVTIRPAATNTELHAIGIYKGSDLRNSNTNLDQGDAGVTVNRPGKPVTLMLSADMPVCWHVTVAPGSEVARVFLGGTEPKEVQGLPAGVEVTRVPIWLGWTIGTGEFQAGVARLHEMTGLELSSFQGNYVATFPQPFVVDHVDTDPRLRSDYPEPVPATGLPNLSFKLNFYHEGGEGVLTQNYTLSGVEGGGLLIPAMRVVTDANGRFYYGATDQRVLKVDSQTGSWQLVTPQAGLEGVSWPMGVTYDSKRNRFLAVSLGGEGFLYGFDGSGSTNSMEVISSMFNEDLDCVVYHAAEDALYGVRVQGSSAVATLVKFDPQGAPLGNITLPMLPFGIGPTCYRSELVSVGNYLILLLGPDPHFPNSGNVLEQRMYLIDPKTSAVSLVYRQSLQPTTKLPVVQITSPASGTSNLVHKPIELTAVASDVAGWIRSVEFIAGATSIGMAERQEDCGTFILNWTNAQPGSYLVTAWATDNEGAKAGSMPILVTVYDPNRQPWCQILVPYEDAVLYAPTNVPVVIRSVDPDGWVEKLEFFDRDQKIGEQAFYHIPEEPPCETNMTTFVWNNVSPGLHLLVVRVTDDCGASTLATDIPFRVIDPTVPPPVVSISAIDSYASESSTAGYVDTAAFRIRRTGSVDEDLRVWYSIGGTAVNGVDYQQIESSVVIPAGRRSARVQIIPYNDTVPEPVKTVVLRLTSSPMASPFPGYQIESPGVAAAIIEDDDSFSPPPVTRLTDGSVRMRWNGETGVAYQLESSPDLKNWKVMQQITATGGAVDFIEVKPTGNGAQFYRIKPATAQSMAIEED